MIFNCNNSVNKSPKKNKHNENLKEKDNKIKIIITISFKNIINPIYNDGSELPFSITLNNSKYIN